MLAAVADLKSLLSISNNADDTALGDLLTRVSRRAANFCDRALEREAAAVEYRDSKRAFGLRHYPVESLVLNYDTSRVFSASTNLVADQDYVLDSRTGVVTLLCCVAEFPQAFKCTVTGGYADPSNTIPSGATEAPDDLQRAILQQCEFEWKNHPDFGKSSISMSGQSVAIAEFDLLADVKATLNSYKRITF